MDISVKAAAAMAPRADKDYIHVLPRLERAV